MVYMSRAVRSKKYRYIHNYMPHELCAANKYLFQGQVPAIMANSYEKMVIATKIKAPIEYKSQ